MSIQKMFGTLVLLFGPFYGYTQTQTDSIVYDIDGLIYKIYHTDSKNEEYFDVNGVNRSIIKIENDSLEGLHLRIAKIVGKDLKIPRSYIDNTPIEDFKSTLIFKLSFLIEKNGEISNLRLIGKLPKEITSEQLFPRRFDLPLLKPFINNQGESILVERVADIYVTCYCSPPRKHIN